MGWCNRGFEPRTPCLPGKIGGAIACRGLPFELRRGRFVPLSLASCRRNCGTNCGTLLVSPTRWRARRNRFEDGSGRVPSPSGLRSLGISNSDHADCLVLVIPATPGLLLVWRRIWHKSTRSNIKAFSYRMRCRCRGSVANDSSKVVDFVWKKYPPIA
jgi:hypothetical protein